MSDQPDIHYYWKHVKLGDMASQGESYSLQLGEYSPGDAGYGAAKKKINIRGANADYGHTFSVSMLKDYAGSETEAAFRGRVRQNLLDIQGAAIITSSGESNLGTLSQVTNGFNTTTLADVTAGGTVTIGCADAAGFDALSVSANDKVLIIDVNTPTICEIFTVNSVDDPADEIEAAELVYSYTAGSSMFKVDWQMPHCWPDSEITYTASSSVRSRFDASMSFRGADDWTTP